MLMITTVLPVIGTSNSGYETPYNDLGSMSVVTVYSQTRVLYLGESVSEMVRRIKCNTLDEVIDQDFSDHIGWGMRFIKDRPNAQGFTPSLETLTKVEIPFFPIGNPPDHSTITMSLKSNLESEEILASMSIDANEIVQITWIEFDIQDITVIPGNEYFIICESTTEDYDNDYYCWVMGPPDVDYLNGDPWSCYSGKWKKYTNYQWDFCFRTYGILEDNTPPEQPLTPEGPHQGTLKVNYTFSTSTTDPENDMVYYLWDWGDGRDSDWIGPYDSGETCEITNMWHLKGTYEIKVKSKDRWGYESDWSDPLEVSMPKIRTFNPILHWAMRMLERFPFLHSLLFC